MATGSALPENSFPPRCGGVFAACLGAAILALSVLVPAGAARASDRIRAGTIEITSRATVGNKGIVTSGMNLTDVRISESLKVDVVFRKSRENQRVRIYETERASARYRSEFSGTIGMAGEVFRQEHTPVETASADRTLPPSDCALMLAIDLLKRQYRLTGRVTVRDVPVMDLERMTADLAGVYHATESSSETYTEDRTEEVEITGTLPEGDAEGKGVLNGSMPLWGAAPPEATAWIRSLAKGLLDMEIDGSTNWDIRVPMLVIERNEEEISDRRQEETVGARVRLRGRPSPAHLASEPGDWELAGKCATKFEAGPSRGEPTLLEPADLQGTQEVEFFWFDRGDEMRVAYTAVVEGEKLSAETTFTVKRPPVSVTVTPPSSDQVGPPLHGRALDPACCACCLDSRPPDPGGGEPAWRQDPCDTPVWWQSGLMTITANGADAAEGDIQFVQLIESRLLYQGVDEEGRPIRRLHRVERALDTCYPAQEENTPVFQDAPGMVLKHETYGFAEARFELETWLMFRPDKDADGDPEWVPLHVVHWAREGAARKSGRCSWGAEPAGEIARADRSLGGSPAWGEGGGSFHSSEETSEYPRWRSCSSGEPGSGSAGETTWVSTYEPGSGDWSPWRPEPAEGGTNP